MNQKLVGVFLIVGYLVYGTSLAGNHGRTSLPDENVLSRISKADLTYEKPVVSSQAGMPVGNGRMGTLGVDVSYSLEISG